ncbi:MAG TPA: hypothetical protein VGC50_10005 [Gammaproteobacteria bacterium]
MSRTKLFSCIGLMALLPGLAFSTALSVEGNGDALFASVITETVERGSGSIEFPENQPEDAPVKCCWIFMNGQWYCIWC